MLRTVLAVVLALALLGASLPAVEHARMAQSDAAGERATATFVRGLDHIRTNDPVPVRVPGARRVVRLDLADGSGSSARLDAVFIGGVPNGSDVADGPSTDVVGYRLVGGETRTRAVDIDLRVARNGSLLDDTTPLVVRDDTPLVLRLVEHRGAPTVTVRAFKSPNGSNPAHA